MNENQLLKNRRALVVLSGGQDSTYCLGVAVRDHGRHNVEAITFNYGQTHSREIKAAHDIAAFFGVEHLVVDVPGVLWSTSPLTDREQPLEQYESAQQMDSVIGDRVEKTFVPMRNALFLTLAANRAVALECDDIYTGVCEDDNANYPDCRQTFILAQEMAINKALGLDGAIRIRTPLLHMSKAEQCHKGLKVPGVYEAWSLSHTAYDGQYPPTGADHATVLRAASFEEAGIPDPLVARAYFDGLMDLPRTENYHPLRRGLIGSVAVLVAYMTQGAD